jgi:hypothetical protein
MANWISVLSDGAFEKPLVVDFLYSHAKYSRPPTSAGLAKRPTAITADWSGCFTDHDLPQLLIIGVGYEPNIALSFCEFLDPASIVAFRPSNHDPRYTSAIDKENELFFDYLDRRRERVANYDVFRPFDLYQTLGYMLLTSLDRYRINIAPYGLKLFALASFLAAAAFRSNVLVWHLNPEQRVTKTPNRIASGEISFLRVDVERKVSAETR